MVILLAACDRRGAEPHITEQTLAAFLSCELKVEPDGDPVWTPSGRRSERSAFLTEKAKSEAHARDCGYKSAAELARLRVRMAVAFAEVRDEHVLRQYPDGYPKEKRERTLAALQERVLRGDSVEQELVARKEALAKLEARLNRIMARNKRSPAATLDISALDDDMQKTYTIDTKLLAAESKLQPALTDDERGIVRQHLLAH